MDSVLAQFQAAFTASPSAVMLMNGNGQILLTNARLDKLFGYAPGELVGQLVEILVPEEMREQHPELRDAFFRLPSTRDMGVGRDLFGVAKDGRRIPLEIALNPVETAAGIIVLAAILDITLRKHQAENVRMAIDAASTAMVMVDPKGAIVLINARTCETFGYDEAELVGKPVEILIPDRFRRRHAVYRTSYVQAPRRRQMGEGDLFGRRKDGTEFPIEIGLTPIDSHDGSFVMSTIQDITERKQVAAEMASRNRDLALLNEELSQFAYSASHDLKAPLASISGLLDCVAQDLKAGDLVEVASNVDRAQSLATMLAQRIEDVLALAKTDHREESWHPVALAEILAALEERTSQEMRRKGIRFEIALGHDDPIVSESTRLGQVLENLVDNAVKYADPRKLAPVVRVETKVLLGRLHILVSDNGIGIPVDRHADVFKMFTRFGNHDRNGSGLGLALVRKHVDRLGGEIGFTSSPEGTSFEIVLPLLARAGGAS